MFASKQAATLKLAVSAGVPSSKLAALLALQREEDPQATISLHQVSFTELITGLREGHYNIGMTLLGVTDPLLSSQPLWRECMAAVVPVHSPLLGQASLTVDELLNYTVLRWQAESCAALDQRISTLLAGRQQAIQCVASFEMMAMLVAAGFGVGVPAQSRITQAHGWALNMRPFADGPYELATHLLRPAERPDHAAEQFARRALQITAAD